MATTTNFAWETPDDTDLVKDGAAAIRTLGSSIDTSLVDLKGGTTNQVLAKNSNTDMDFKWVADAAGMTNPMTTTGDVIYSSSGSTPARLGLGTAGQVLKVNSGATAPEWAAAPATSGPAFSAARVDTDVSFSSATWTKVVFTVELFDTDSCFATSTFTPNKAGYYQINGNAQVYSTTANHTMIVAIYKNGASWTNNNLTSPGNYGGQSAQNLMYLNGTTDYVELYVYSTGSSPIYVSGASKDYPLLNGVWIRG